MLCKESDFITYATKDGTAHEYEALEFLALLTCHLPKKYESTTRYYGHYSSRLRGKRAKLRRGVGKPNCCHKLHNCIRQLLSGVKWIGRESFN